MFNALANFLIKIITWIASKVVSLITLPIYLILRPFLPDLPTQLDIFHDFLTDHVFRGVAFAREVFFNVTGFPRPLFYALITFFLFKLGFYLTALAIKFVINIYRIIRGSRTTD